MNEAGATGTGPSGLATVRVGFNGELDEPGEPCVWGDKIIVSCFDLVTDEEKVNTAHEMPATMSMLDVEL